MRNARPSNPIVKGPGAATGEHLATFFLGQPEVIGKLGYKITSYVLLTVMVRPQKRAHYELEVRDWQIQVLKLI